MTYNQLFHKAINVLKKIKSDSDVDDYRPMYVNPTSRKVNDDITDKCVTIPNAITIFLKNGDKIVYIAKGSEQA